MKILFICGSLESGKDGVGDYTRLLANELLRRGHEVFLIAINDRHVVSIQNYQTEIFELRLPSNLSWEEKTIQTQSIIDKESPDWISLQYVPYSYHSKGIALNLNLFLNKLKFSSKLHIMFHELWLGLNPNSSLKHKIMGFFQKKIIISLAKNAKVNTLTTSNILYINSLKKNEIVVKKLQLFSNIPRNNLQKNYIRSKFNIEENVIIIGIFGSLHLNINFDDIIFEYISKNSSNDLLILSFGRVGNLQAWDRLVEKWSSKVNFKRLGILDYQDVSALMQQTDIAISSTPLEYLGKSGVYAAWKLHGVPVVAKPLFDFGLFQNELEEQYLFMESSSPENWHVSSVTNQLLSILTSN